MGAEDDKMLIRAVQNATAATVAAAVITSASRPHSIAEAIQVYETVKGAMFPQRDRGASSNASAIEKVHK